MRIGVLAVQGAFAEHIAVLAKLGVEAAAVRLPGELEGLNGLIIPGGESTTICRLMRLYSLTGAVKERAKGGLPVWGTCAGMIMLAQRNSHPDPEPLELMDIHVKRNAFGRQKESFETELSIPVLGKKPFPGVFIRAPLIERVNDGVEVLARLPDKGIVAVRQAKRLACAFHPELTSDTRFHQYFLDIIAGKR